MNKLNLAQRDHRRFWCLLGLLLLLIMIRYALQIDLPRIIFLAVIALIALLGDQNEIVAMCICLVPMHESVDFFYATAIVVGVFVLKYHRQIRLGTHVLVVILAIIWELLHCFRTTFSIVEFLSCICPFVVLAVIMASNAEQLDYLFIVRAFSWATLGCSMILLLRVLYFSDFNFLLAVAGLQRMGADKHSGIQDVAVDGGQMNPNTLGIITVLATAGLMQMRNKKVSKKIDMVLVCALLVFAALGTSRTYLACLAFMILLLFFAETGGFVKKLRLLGVLSVAVAAAIGVLAVVFPDTFDYFIGRFFETDITTGRDNLMVQYHRFIVNNPKVMFFGIGIQDYGNQLINVYRVWSHVPHNALQEIIIAWGIPGILVFLVLFFSMFRVASQKNKRIKLINWIPLLIILFKGLAGQMLTSPYTMLAFSFAYLSLCTDLTPEKPNQPSADGLDAMQEIEKRS